MRKIILSSLLALNIAPFVLFHFVSRAGGHLHMNLVDYQVSFFTLGLFGASPVYVEGSNIYGLMNIIAGLFFYVVMFYALGYFRFEREYTDIIEARVVLGIHKRENEGVIKADIIQELKLERQEGKLPWLLRQVVEDQVNPLVTKFESTFRLEVKD